MKPINCKPEFELVTAPSFQEKLTLHSQLFRRGYVFHDDSLLWNLSDYDYSALRAFANHFGGVTYERVSYLVKKLPPKPKPKFAETEVDIFGTDDGYDRLRDLHGQRIKKWFR